MNFLNRLAVSIKPAQDDDHDLGTDPFGAKLQQIPPANGAPPEVTPPATPSPDPVDPDPRGEKTTEKTPAGPGHGPAATTTTTKRAGLRSTVAAAASAWCYYVFVRPAMLLWLLASFPFTYVFGSDYPALPHSELGDEGVPLDEKSAAIDEKTAMLKEEKIISNDIKSPTASKYIIPPPMRLFPLSRNPDKKRRRKTLVLDLDETLIHSMSRGAPRQLGSGSHMIELRVNNVATLYHVYKRPFCDHFLREVARWFDLQIFTASVKEYADPIIDWLESDLIDYKTTGDPQPIFLRRYYRTDCTFRPGVGYIKDLSLFFPKDDELKNVIILDNSPTSYALHEDNAVVIEGWINDQSDRDLLNLLPMLYSLSVCIDVRFILGLRSGEKLFENL